ncbi:MAG: N-acetylneuraminate synthase family protein [Candidatus Methanoperedens sp.]|nr:N-acetylneuraminate synthase family protein [Candidatus Methanoperedens sp.]MCZ7394874.1 N-acetylneuraminate synthase family protein [Candidatus Methanoperedens sp.]
MKPATVVAEIGCNHMGDINIAKEMIETAKYFCKAEVVKFQKRNPKECLTEAEYNAPHPVEYHAYGKTYGKHREFLEFNLNQHKELKSYCEQMGIIYSSSVWDMTSAKEIVSLNPKFIKIPSAINTNFEILEYICNNFQGDIHLSLGMTTHKEEEDIVDLVKEQKRNKDVVLYACTSGYPVPDESVCLLEIKRLREKFLDDIKAIGYSGHHNGIAIDIAAFVLGAEYIERHFTLNRTWKGTDHAASLEPDGLRRVIRDIKSVSSAMTYKSEEILDIEKVQRKKLKWNCKSW